MSEGRSGSFLGTTGAQIGISLATQAVAQAGYYLFEELTGSRYSDAELSRYGLLTLLYKKNLKQEILPFFWVLNNKSPACRIRPQNWSAYANSLNEGQVQTARYFRQSALIAEQISLYMTARAKRWIGSGSPGDLLELFMSEWLHFAMVELPTYQYDDESIAKLKARAAYLKAVMQADDLFKPGFLQLKKNKFDVMYSISQELDDCLRLAKAQVLRETAKESLSACVGNTSKLLSACLNTIYYARASAVHDEPLQLQNYLNPQQPILGKATQNCYKRVTLTHTGEILRDTALLAGLDSFGAPALGSDQPAESSYFNRNFSPKVMEWDKAKMDLPCWLKENEPFYLESTQQLAESMLRIAQLKRLLDEVCALAGDLGNVWAYGDRRGKLSLECLLFLLEKELQALNRCYLVLYKYQDGLREQHKRANRKSQNKTENSNFNRVDQEKAKVEELQEKICKTIHKLRTQMGSFTEEELGRIHERKGRFYQGIAAYAQQYYPRDYEARFCILTQPLTVEEAVADFGLDKPLLDRELIKKRESSSIWGDFFSGESFLTWRKTYFTNHQPDYQKLAVLLAQFEREPRQDVAMLVNKQLAQMKIQANQKRPTWQCGWFYLNVGWPFKRGLNQNVDLLFSEFQLLEQDIKNSLAANSVSSTEAEQTAASLFRPDLRIKHWFKQKEAATIYYPNHQASLFKLGQRVATGQKREDFRLTQTNTARAGACSQSKKGMFLN